MIKRSKRICPKFNETFFMILTHCGEDANFCCSSSQLDREKKRNFSKRAAAKKVRLTTKPADRPTVFSISFLDFRMSVNQVFFTLLTRALDKREPNFLHFLTLFFRRFHSVFKKSGSMRLFLNFKTVCFSLTSSFLQAHSV